MNFTNGKQFHTPNQDQASFVQSHSPRSTSMRFTQKAWQPQDLLVSKLKREIDDLNVQEYDFEAFQGEIKSTELKIKDLTLNLGQQNSELRSEREKTLLEMARSQTKLRGLQKRYDKIETERSKYFLENADAEMIVKNRHHKFVQTNDILKDATLVYRNVRNDFDRIRKEAHFVIEEKIHLRDSIEALEKQLEEKLSIFKALKEKVIRQESQLVNYSNIKNRIEAENVVLGDHGKNLDKEISQIDNQIFMATMDLNNLLSEIQKSKNEAFILNNDILALENKILKKKDSISEKEDLMKEMTDKIDTEREITFKKEDFLLHLKQQEEEKNEIIEMRKKEAENYRTKIEQLKVFSERAFEEMKDYVRLDKFVKESFHRVYEKSCLLLANESTMRMHSVVNTY